MHRIIWTSYGGAFYYGRSVFINLDETYDIVETRVLNPEILPDNVLEKKVILDIL